MKATLQEGIWQEFLMETQLCSSETILTDVQKTSNQGVEVVLF